MSLPISESALSLQKLLKSISRSDQELGYHDQETEEELVPQAWEVENGQSPRVTLRSLL